MKLDSYISQLALPSGGVAPGRKPYTIWKPAFRKKRSVMNSKGRLIPISGKLGAKVTPAQALPSSMGTVPPHTGHGGRAGSGNGVPPLHPIALGWLGQARQGPEKLCEISLCVGIARAIIKSYIQMVSHKTLYRTMPLFRYVLKSI